MPGEDFRSSEAIFETYRSDYQQILAAVTALLRLDTTLIDERLVRIAGTGLYEARLGESILPDSSFGEALKTGKPVIIEQPRLEPVCQRCQVRSFCQETAHVASPITRDGRSLGILGFVAFSEEQREQLLHGLDRYADFLERISDLIASRMNEERTVRALLETEGFLHAMADSVAEGLAGVDKYGRVTFLNGPIRNLLRLKEGEAPSRVEQISGLDHIVHQVLASGEAVADREITITSNGGTVRLVGTVRPIRVKERVEGAVASLRDIREVHDLVYRMAADQPVWGIERIIFQSQAMARVVERTIRVAAGQSTVLIRGESGTGKELIARALHAASPRRDRPFVAINCAAIPEDLLESELFGFADGAFTGARKGGKPGKFELAHRGTIFLDEIGDTSLRLQAKLLRVLQESEVDRIGGTSPIRLDVRVVAATNRDLEGMIHRKEFREDLYFRLNVIPLEIPPVRQRREDIPLLLDYFSRSFFKQRNGPIPHFSEEAQSLLLAYDWPGNIREIQNTVEYALNMAVGPALDIECLPARIRETAAPAERRERRGDGPTCLSEFEREQLVYGLERYGRGEKAITQIARDMGISRATVYRRMQKYGLLPPRLQKESARESSQSETTEPLKMRGW